MKWEIIRKTEKGIHFHSKGFYGEYLFPVQIGLEKTPPQWIINGFGLEWLGTGNTPNPRSLINDFERYTDLNWSEEWNKYLKTGRYALPLKEITKNAIQRQASKSNHANHSGLS